MAGLEILKTLVTQLEEAKGDAKASAVLLKWVEDGGLNIAKERLGSELSKASGVPQRHTLKYVPGEWYETSSILQDKLAADAGVTYIHSISTHDNYTEDLVHFPLDLEDTIKKFTDVYEYFAADGWLGDYKGQHKNGQLNLWDDKLTLHLLDKPQGDYKHVVSKTLASPDAEGLRTVYDALMANPLIVRHTESSDLTTATELKKKAAEEAEYAARVAVLPLATAGGLPLPGGVGYLPLPGAGARSPRQRTAIPLPPRR
ncbi:Hypothetical protein POVN_LOCUS125 [uncultured virus]|nr:Hypothetical protein POVN_LOCUS125 [uncultured virus]